MIGFIQKMFAKYKEIILYLFFGGLTTVVNLAVYYPLYNMAGLSGTVSNIIAWAAAVLFAFFTNKPFVFESHDWSKAVVLPEFAKFVGCRVGSGVLETVFIAVTVDLLKLNGNFMKVIIAVAVVLINYVGSKLLFKKK